VGGTDDAAVHQVVRQVVVQGAHEIAVARMVDEGRRRLPRQGRAFRVGDHLVVAAQALDEFPVAVGGDPDHLAPIPAGEQVRQGDAGLAGGAAHHVALGTEAVVIGEVAVDQEGGHEQTAQQHDLVLAVRLVDRIGRDLQVLAIRLGVLLAVGHAVDELARPDVLRLDPQVSSHGEEPEDPLALGDVRMVRVDHVCEAHHRDPPEALRGREEAPVVEHVPGGRVGDVVRGQGEAVHPQQHLPRGQVGDLLGIEVALAPVVPMDQEVHCAA
jgi:hypothetical protein